MCGVDPPRPRIYYRDVHLPDVLVFRPMGQSCVDDVTWATLKVL